MTGKNIIISSDGTGNAGGKGYDSNVWRLHTAIDKHTHLTHFDHPKQVTFYHDGVGTDDNKIIKIIGGAIGFGLRRIVIDMYIFLINNYEKGDKIYLFGFSRGAYSIRILSGMITKIGILDKNRNTRENDHSTRKLVEFLYKEFMLENQNVKNRNLHKGLKSKLGRSFYVLRYKYVKKASAKNRKNLPKKDYLLPVKIRFVGIWDTVDAYAIPSDLFASFFDFLFYTSFRQYDNTCKNVDTARQALSIDDDRRIFEPVLWNEDESDENTNMQQVWFSGSHSNVGGGYPKQGLAWITLEWMMQEARASGLHFVPGDIHQYIEKKDVNDRMYNPRSGLAAYYAFKQRDIRELWQKYGSKKTRPNIHISVFERIIGQAQGYAPANLPEEFEIIAPHTEYRSFDLNSGSYSICSHKHHKNDVVNLQDMISSELKNFNKSSKKATGYEKFLQKVQQSSAYLAFSMQFAFLVGVIYTTGFSWAGVFIFITLSLLWWGVIWYFVTQAQKREHKKYSKFWRSTIKNTKWNFLRL